MTVAAHLTETSQQLNIACPLYDKQTRGCQQSSTPAPLQRSVCHSDEHDACPIYLGYLLRRTRMIRCDNDWLDAR